MKIALTPFLIAVGHLSEQADAQQRLRALPGAVLEVDAAAVEATSLSMDMIIAGGGGHVDWEGAAGGAKSAKSAKSAQSLDPKSHTHCSSLPGTDSSYGIVCVHGADCPMPNNGFTVGPSCYGACILPGRGTSCHCITTNRKCPEMPPPPGSYNEDLLVALQNQLPESPPTPL